MTTEATLQHHLQAFSEGVDSILADYSEASVLLTQDGPVAGLAELRRFFERFVDGLPSGFLDAFTVLHRSVSGEVALLVWEARPWVAFGVDTLVVRDGRIVVQTFASHPGS